MNKKKRSQGYNTLDDQVNVPSLRPGVKCDVKDIPLQYTHVRTSDMPTSYTVIYAGVLLRRPNILPRPLLDSSVRMGCTAGAVLPPGGPELRRKAARSDVSLLYVPAAGSRGSNFFIGTRPDGPETDEMRGRPADCGSIDPYLS